ncbi:hypothetical protein GCM10011579_072820 [Streptomyces albiflavescens]|uniref:Uncharacterized protein n=1 Tax=Streptomyces albiflavescens TaxID=1623582 RepID=A0A917YBM6_9ACTN|nr:hypothetical protein GCM10011579_072820 [Streptomyces albiflavescens]
MRCHDGLLRAGAARGAENVAPTPPYKRKPPAVPCQTVTCAMRRRSRRPPADDPPPQGTLPPLFVMPLMPLMPLSKFEWKGGARASGAVRRGAGGCGVGAEEGLASGR